jgi:hypothetical protein
LPVVLYGSETWSFTLKKKHRLKKSENGVLRKIFGPTKYEVTGEWKRLRVSAKSALHTKYYSDDDIEKIGGACGTYGGRRGAYRILIRISERKRLLG